MHLCLIVGTRPQIIKSQSIIKEILSHKLELTIIHTGQHYDYQMSKVFFEEMKIRNPDYNLGINTNSSSRELADIISKLEKPLTKINPDIVLVPGDTRSALGAALSANRLGLKLAHIESGARSYDFELEEEINRKLIDHCSNILFAPTMNCYKNLKKESILGSAYFTGDTMYDSFLDYKKKLNLKNSHDGNFALLTLHRIQNIQDKQKIKKIINLVKQISKLGYEIIFPIHPHTKKRFKEFDLSLNGIQIMDPVKYSEMLQMLSSANLLLTDSGGLQKEAYWLDTPCVTLRKNTEWIETLDGGNNILLHNIKNSDIKKIIILLNRKHRKKSKSTKLFGDGKAAKKIISILLK